MLSETRGAPRRLRLSLLFLAAAVTASAQCYQFSGGGATLQITVSTINFQSGPTNVDGYITTNVNFSGTNSLTVGGSTLNTQSVFDGSVYMFYSPALDGIPDATTFQILVPSTQEGQSWEALLIGNGNLIPGDNLPQTLPPASAWMFQSGNSPPNLNDYIQVNPPSGAKYTITSVSSCGSGSGSGTSTSATSPIQDLGDPASLPGGCGCSEPVSLGTGNLYYEADDYQTSGQNPLRFTRYYNSMAGASGTSLATSLGANWRSNYDRYLRLVSSSSVIAERPNGQQVTFTLNGTVWTTDTDIDLALTNSGVMWTLTDQQDTVETYAASGTVATLQEIKARNGYDQVLQYNGTAQLQSVTDTFARQLTLAYSNGMLQSVTTPDGLVLTYAYSSSSGSSVLTSVSYSTTPVTSQTYVYGNSSIPSALTGVIDEDGATYDSWTYDSTGRVLTSQQAGGANLISIVYNDTDGSRMVTNPLGLQEVYKFTMLQGIPKVTEVDRPATSTTAAATSTYSYDSNGYRSSQTDWNGIVTNYVNDVHGQPLSITEAAGSPQARSTTASYLQTFHLPVQIVTPGLTSSFTYDASGELLTKTLTDTTANATPYSTNGETRTWTYTWGNFLETSVQSPRTDLTAVTKLGYDSSGALTSITNALNQVITVTQHLPGGLPLTWTDANGVAYTATYDARQRRLTRTVSTAAGPLTTKYAYDGVGNVLSKTLPDGSAISNTYDGAHRLIGASDLLQDSVAFTLDAMGDRTAAAVSNPAGVKTRQRSATYDDLGRFLQEIDGAGQVTTLGYDADGDPLFITDPLQHAAQETFDNLNRLATITDPAKGVTTLSYDARNHPLSLTDPSGVTTTFTYNGFGDLIQQASPASGTTIYSYDSAGDLVNQVDGRGSGAIFTYDALNRRTAEIYLDASENVTYTYDQTGSGFGFGVGKLTSVMDAAGTLTRSYDERGNMLTETRMRTSRTPVVTLKTIYTYDHADRVSSISYPSGALVSYARDSTGRTTGATVKPAGASQASAVASNVVSSVVHLPFGPIASFTFGNGVKETRTFDLDYRMTALDDAGNSPIQALSYRYDANNNALSIADAVTPANSQSLGYDSLDRLTSASGGYGSIAYAYDPNGNRLTDAASAPQGPGLDGLGSMTTLVYNQAGRLGSASAGAQQLVQYTYDAFGRRVEKFSGSTNSTTLFDYDSRGHLLEEADTQGNPLGDYIYVDGRVVAMLSTAGNLYFLHTDRLGTPQAATDGSQKVVWTGSYQPFGALNPASSQTATLAQDLRLPGQEAEQETGLYHNGYREYAPWTGRYIQSDPIGMAAGPNTYAYVQDNPANMIDPLGLCSLTGVVDDGTSATLSFSDNTTMTVPNWTQLTEAQQLNLVTEVEQTDDDADQQHGQAMQMLEGLFQWTSGLIEKNQPPPEPQAYGSLGIRG